jgi:hypothetical protein
MCVPLLVALALPACAGRPDQAAGQSKSLTDVEFTREATDFAEIVLPPDATVLRVHSESFAGTYYQLAVSMAPADVATLIQESHFTGQLHILPPATYPKILAGPDLASSPSVVSAQDRIITRKGRAVYRTITIDERDAATRIVHLELLAN